MTMKVKVSDFNQSDIEYLKKKQENEIDNKLMELLNRVELKPDIIAVRKYIISLINKRRK